jgi:hypothetical protein
VITAVLKDGYRYDGESVEIDQPLTEPQFRAIEHILGKSPQRFKSYAQAFHFEPSSPDRTSSLLEYLASERITHSTELRQTWRVRRDASADHTPRSCDLSVSELAALAVREGLSSEDLDEDVHDVASKSATNTNNEGLDSQIQYLVLRLGSGQTRVLIERANGQGFACAECSPEVPGTTTDTHGVTPALRGEDSTAGPDDSQPLFTERELDGAANRAADEILDAIGATDEGQRDLANLLVNTTAFYLTHPNATLNEAIENAYSDPVADVLEWPNR